jgi:hypothetical protein
MGAGCGFAGFRWSADAAQHMAWCQAASPRERGRENEERLKALFQCRGDAGPVPVANCNDYVARARSQVDLAKSLGSFCRFEGMRWSENLVQHMNWCNRNDSNKQALEDGERRKQLAECNAPSRR